MGQIQRAARVVAPRVGADTNTTVRLYDSTSTSQASAVPNSWAGRYVAMYASTDVQYYFSTDSTDAVDETITANAAGNAQDDLGGILPSGQFIHRQIPDRKPSETMYFVRASVASGSVRMELADDPDEVL
jgi:hypothetical protein